MYIYIHTYIYINIHTYIYIYKYIHTYMYTYTYMLIRTVTLKFMSTKTVKNHVAGRPQKAIVKTASTSSSTIVAASLEPLVSCGTIYHLNHNRLSIYPSIYPSISSIHLHHPLHHFTRFTLGGRSHWSYCYSWRSFGEMVTPCHTYGAGVEIGAALLLPVAEMVAGCSEFCTISGV